MDARLTYLASPYSHPDPAVREARFQAVCKAAAEMMAEGRMVFSPIAHSHPIALAGALPLDFQYWEAYDRTMLAACTDLTVLTLDGWHKSRGVMTEWQIALDLHMPIEYREPSA
jgi:hypothetical protein